MITTRELEQLVKTIKEQDSFDFTTKANYYGSNKQHFVCVHRGKAKYVYHTTIYSEGFGDLRSNGRLNLFAIFADDTLYLLSKFDVPWFADPASYPDNIMLLSDKKVEIEKEILRTIVAPYIDQLPMLTEATEQEKRKLKAQARKAVIFNKKPAAEQLYEGIVDAYDQRVVDILSGDHTYIEEIKEQLKYDRNLLIARKWRFNYVDSLLSQGNILTAEEAKIINAIDSLLNEATLTITFGYIHPKTGVWTNIGETKVPSSSIRSIMYDNRCFCVYDFQSEKAGFDYLFNARIAGCDKVRIENIERIVYRRKVIFEK